MPNTWQQAALFSFLFICRYSNKFPYTSILVQGFFSALFHIKNVGKMPGPLSTGGSLNFERI